MKTENKNKTGLYVHVPFCSKKCNYCDFYSYRANDEQKELYAQALIEQIRAVAKKYPGRVFDTVYIGGGTPTSLGTRHLCELSDSIHKYLCIEKDAEFTVETNPGLNDTISFSSLAKSGVNRLSTGLQSANDDELEMLGRIHTKRDYIDTLESARTAGIRNISVDIMFSLPSQDKRKLERTLDFVINSSPEHISAYSLKIEPGTPFYDMRDKLALPDEDTDADMYLYICSRLKDAGFNHYEISNFAKLGHESRHNLKYWRAEEYIGLGPAAHSYIDNRRYAYARDTGRYIDVFSSNAAYEDELICESSYIGDDELEFERLMLGLRLSEGISDSLLEKFGELNGTYKKLAPLIREGYVFKTENGIALSDKGMFVSNYIINLIRDKDS